MIYEFTPTQDLHGYSKPWAPGAGKNLTNFPDTTGERPTANLTYQNFVGFGVQIEDGVTYTFSADITSSAEPFMISAMRSDSDSGVPTTELARSSAAASGRRSISFTGDEASAGKWFSFRIQYNVNTAFKYSLKNAMLEKSATATSYAPYANICPIEGYNIWDPTNAKMVPVYSGYVDAEGRKLYLHPVYEEYDGQELLGPWMSSMDKYTEEGTPTTGAFVVDFGGEVTEYDITDFMLQTLLDSLGVRRFFASGAMLLNSLMDQAQGRVRSEEELLNRALPIHVIAIGKELPGNLVIKKPISDVLPGLPGKFIR